MLVEQSVHLRLWTVIASIMSHQSELDQVLDHTVRKWIISFNLNKVQTVENSYFVWKNIYWVQKYERTNWYSSLRFKEIGINSVLILKILSINLSRISFWLTYWKIASVSMKHTLMIHQRCWSFESSTPKCLAIVHIREMIHIHLFSS